MSSTPPHAPGTGTGPAPGNRPGTAPTPAPTTTPTPITTPTPAPAHPLLPAGPPPVRLDVLAGRAAPWIGGAEATPALHTGAVVADRFDRIAWHDTYEQSAALRALDAELSARHAPAADLLADVFLAAYKLRPELRDRTAMSPSHLVNHHVLAALLDSPDHAELHRETAGDPYAAALAVLAQAGAVRELLERDGAAQEEGERVRQAQRYAADAADAVGEALQRAAAQAGADGTVPGQAADTVRRAVATAEAAARRAAEGTARTLAAPPAPGFRAVARSGTASAARSVREEAALMRAWGVGPGELERLPFDRRARLAERLRTGRLAQWAELIGRFRQMADAERARKVEHGTGELIGVTLGDDLSRVIPSELAGLGVPALRAVFAARYAAGELMLYDTEGERPSGRGAVIACVDTSHSMYEAGPGGVTREAWSKACALALLDQARRGGRDFVGILFSSADRIRVFRFPSGRAPGIADVLDFAETFLGGGTSYQAPLSVAGQVLEEEYQATGRTHGDIVLITDDECGVTEEWTRGWNEARHRLGFRLFGVAVGAPRVAGAGSVLEALCDNLRSVEDLTDVHGTADIFRVI
ncbi:VWA domain-containing protein [Streptomyces sp. NPDC093085]|uniref:VWA domain-containing protein n=1 Tax=Streptomyces sp. NPDC093085 TaxID=3155068 RepID=UPI00343CB6E1